MKQLLTVSLSDFKMIFRDPTLRVFFLLPIMVFAVINGALPWLISKYPVVEEYAIYVVVIATIEVTQMFGFIYSIVLIEEKEQEVSKVYGVMPISRISFTLFRMLIPVIITILLTWLILILQPFYDIPLAYSLLFSLIAGLVVPPYVLLVAVMSKNKMEGMVWIKVVNLAVVVPAAAFFIPKSFGWLFGFLPTHWAFQGLHDLMLNESFVLELAAAAGLLVLFTTLLLRRFSKTHFA